MKRVIEKNTIEINYTKKPYHEISEELLQALPAQEGLEVRSRSDVPFYVRNRLVRGVQRTFEKTDTFEVINAFNSIVYYGKAQPVLKRLARLTDYDTPF